MTASTPAQAPARRKKRRIEGLHRDDRVGIEPVDTVLYGSLDPLKMLWRMCGLNQAFRRLFRRYLGKAVPQLFVAAQGIHHDLITHRRLRMAVPGVVFLIYRVVDNCCLHKKLEPQINTDGRG